MILNQNNFLIWDGEFSKAAFDVIAGDAISSWPQGGQLQYEFPLLGEITATYGLDESTIIVYTDANPITPPIFSIKKQMLIYFADSKFDHGDKIVKYKFKDKAGHESNEGTITLQIGERSTRYIGYPPSATCDISGGFNTGTVNFAERYKIYEDDNSPVMPLVIVDNTNPADPDQIPAHIDYRFCPLTTFTASVTIINNSDVVFPLAARLYTDAVTYHRYDINLTANQSITIKMLPGLAYKLGVYGVPLDPKPPHRMVVRQSGSPDLVDDFAIPGRGYIGGEVMSPNVYDTMQIIIEPLY